VDHLQLVPLATGLSDFEAKVLTARLGAEGIIWQFRGIVDSVYPLGGIDVLVPADELDDARTLLQIMAEDRAVYENHGSTGRAHPDHDLEFGLDPGHDAEESDAPWDRDRATGSYRASRWFATVLLAVMLMFLVVRMFALG
jgi:hypothetical protein